MMRILITGASGFIGFHLVRELAGRGHAITGLDCISDQYDPELKYARLENLGIARTEIEENTIIRSRTLSGFEFVKSNLENRFFFVRFVRQPAFRSGVSSCRTDGNSIFRVPS